MWNNVFIGGRLPESLIYPKVKTIIEKMNSSINLTHANPSYSVIGIWNISCTLDVL